MNFGVVQGLNIILEGLGENVDDKNNHCQEMNTVASN
jgi:hypothetical protein